jgi:hypothetical protein
MQDTTTNTETKGNKKSAWHLAIEYSSSTNFFNIMCIKCTSRQSMKLIPQSIIPHEMLIVS